MKTANELAAMVQQGMALRKRITELEAELEALEGRIIAEALARPAEHERLADDAREGRRYLCPGPAGLVLPVIFTADKLKATIECDSDLEMDLRACAGLDAVDTLYPSRYVRVRAERDGKAFRKLVRAKLEPARAEEFLDLVTERDAAGIPKNDTQVRWQDVDTEAAVRGAMAAEKPKRARKKKGE